MREFARLLCLDETYRSESKADGFLTHTGLFTAVHCRLSRTFFLAPTGGNKDCTMVATAQVLPVGYVVKASRIADRRMVLAGYRLADLLRRLLGN